MKQQPRQQPKQQQLATTMAMAASFRF